jgi:glycerate dehydrogenase
MRIVVLDGHALNPGDLDWSCLQELGDFTVYDRTPEEKIIERSRGAQAIFTNKVAFTKDIISRLPGLQFIGVMATGYNVVDINAAGEAGIVVTNIPAYSTDSVAQMVFSHILNFVQNVSVHAESVRSGEWSESKDFSYHLTPQTELAGKTLGIIGFGRIGGAVAKIGLAFGMKIVFNNRSRKETSPGIIQTDLNTLLNTSDFISINCPLNEDNEKFINEEAIQKMKPDVFLVNTGRGALIDENDLAEALNSGRIAGAGLDVLSEEPPEPDNPLITAKNCYITPHIAWTTTEARRRLMKIASDNLKSFIQGTPKNVIKL